MEGADLAASGKALTVAVIILAAAAGFFIWNRRRLLFRRNALIIHNDREEMLVFVWTALALVLITSLFQSFTG